MTKLFEVVFPIVSSIPNSIYNFNNSKEENDFSDLLIVIISMLPCKGSDPKFILEQ